MQLMLLVVISLSHCSLASGASAATATATSAATGMAPVATATALRTAMRPGHKEEDPFPKWLIDLGSHVSEADTAILSSRKPRVTGKVRGGTFCLNTEECGAGKCCLRRSKDPRRVCKRFQRVGERCTDDQMMGGYYYGYCPCNKRAVCTVVGHVLKCVKKPPLTPLPKPGTRPGTTPPPEEKESQESEEIPQRPAPPPKNPGLNQTKVEFPEIPEFFKNFGTSGDTGPQFPIEGAGQEGGEQGGEEEEEEGGQVPGQTGEDLPEDIISQKASTGTPPEEPPEESSENELPKETTPTGTPSRAGGGNAIPPLLPKPGPHLGSGSPVLPPPTSTMPGPGRGNDILPPLPSPTNPARPKPNSVLTGLPGEHGIPELPPPPV